MTVLSKSYFAITTGLHMSQLFRKKLPGRPISPRDTESERRPMRTSLAKKAEVLRSLTTIEKILHTMAALGLRDIVRLFLHHAAQVLVGVSDSMNGPGPVFTHDSIRAFLDNLRDTFFVPQGRTCSYSLLWISWKACAAQLALPWSNGQTEPKEMLSVTNSWSLAFCKHCCLQQGWNLQVLWGAVQTQAWNG